MKEQKLSLVMKDIRQDPMNNPVTFEDGSSCLSVLVLKGRLRVRKEETVRFHPLLPF